MSSLRQKAIRLITWIVLPYNCEPPRIKKLQNATIAEMNDNLDSIEVLSEKISENKSNIRIIHRIVLLENESC